MEEQKRDIVAFVQTQKVKGQSITESLKALGIKRSTYYSWLSPREEKKTLPNIRELTPSERQTIEETKERYPHLRHRQIQGMLQNQGIYLSMSSVYHHLKAINQVETYERRPSPLKGPKYRIWQRNLMWGCDWTKLLINHVRWYLIVLIDLFSRFIIGLNIHPSINASHVKHLYAMGLKHQGISPKDILPELRVDRGSPNTSWVTKEFFSLMGADISFARVRRPTDNALTERFFGTAKQEEIHIVGSYPDEQSAQYEIGRYTTFYNTERPHQGLWNFTPAFVHELNNNTLLLEKLSQLKYEAKMKRKLYWEGRTI